MNVTVARLNTCVWLPDFDARRLSVLTMVGDGYPGLTLGFVACSVLD